jgi:hypothetical protein
VAYSPLDQKVIDDVAAYGWSCMSVGAGDGEPNFSYSIGWWVSIAAPEAIIFGLPSKLQHSMLTEVFRQARSGLVLSDGLRMSGLIEGHECIARPVHESRVGDYFNFALWYQRIKGGSASSIQAFQIFWPGKHQGLFPWDAGCDESVRAHQPTLYLPKASGIA